MKYPIQIERRWPYWAARVNLYDIPLIYYPRCRDVALSMNRQKAIDQAVALRHEALLNFERGRRQDTPPEALEVEVDLPPVKRGPVWR